MDYETIESDHVTWLLRGGIARPEFQSDIELGIKQPRMEFVFS